VIGLFYKKNFKKSSGKVFFKNLSRQKVNSDGMEASEKMCLKENKIGDKTEKE